MSDEHAHHYTFLFLLINFLRKRNHEIADMIVTPKAQITKTKMDMIKSSKKNVFLLLNNFTCARIYRFVLRNIEKKVLLRNYCLPYPNFWENFFELVGVRFGHVLCELVSIHIRIVDPMVPAFTARRRS